MFYLNGDEVNIAVKSYVDNPEISEILVYLKCHFKRFERFFFRALH